MCLSVYTVYHYSYIHTHKHGCGNVGQGHRPAAQHPSQTPVRPVLSSLPFLLWRCFITTALRILTQLHQQETPLSEEEVHSFQRQIRAVYTQTHTHTHTRLMCTVRYRERAGSAGGTTAVMVRARVNKNTTTTPELIPLIRRRASLAGQSRFQSPLPTTTTTTTIR